MQRRELLKALACTGLATASSLRNLSFAAQPSGTLVVVFLRGGADSLHMAAPVNDRYYVANRPNDLRITDGAQNAGLRLPKEFAAQQDCRIHPAAAPLLDLFQSGHAQLLHAAWPTRHAATLWRKRSWSPVRKIKTAFWPLYPDGSHRSSAPLKRAKALTLWPPPQAKFAAFKD